MSKASTSRSPRGLDWIGTGPAPLAGFLLRGEGVPAPIPGTPRGAPSVVCLRGSVPPLHVGSLKKEPFSLGRGSVFLQCFTARLGCSWCCRRGSRSLAQGKQGASFLI
ncbi:unnamed protein product [Prorocentrum cordatum]|uniref:Uncharacterized protein n=1 Tax=Prorocentrum cordatum TaxID=2364126 RepID=A0ABN9V134_9DINO|nr:unnamed protein product [Polarella glacialis]